MFNACTRLIVGAFIDWLLLLSSLNICWLILYIWLRYTVLHDVDCCCLSTALHRPSNQFFPICLCVCEQIGLRPQFFTDFHQVFACVSQMCSRRRLLFARPTGSSLPILEVCGFRFWQFSVFGDHIFQQISTKSDTQIKFSNADFVFNGEWNRR